MKERNRRKLLQESANAKLVESMGKVSGDVMSQLREHFGGVMKLGKREHSQMQQQEHSLNGGDDEDMEEEKEQQKEPSCYGEEDNEEEMEEVVGDEG